MTRLRDATGSLHVIASNLHVGGGVQVAASLLDETAALAQEGAFPHLLGRLSFEVSTEVARNVLPETLSLLNLEVRDRRPHRIWHWIGDRRKRHEAVLVVFGPLYARPRATKRLMGYADVTSIFDEDHGAARSRGLRGRLRARLSRWEVSRQDAVIVETTAMEDRLGALLPVLRRPEIHVVPNSVNSRVTSAAVDDSLRRRIRAARGEADLVLGYPTRDYPHKNLEFLPALARSTAARGVRVLFLVTLREDEWRRRSPAFRDVCLNLGELGIDQVGTVLCQSDGVIFPSLLEAYSATPVEALALGRPLYASDRDFVRSVVGDACVYFDPLDAEAAADAICRDMAEESARTARVERGRQVVAGLPTARDRAVAYLRLLDPATSPTHEPR